MPDEVPSQAAARRFPASQRLRLRRQPRRHAEIVQQPVGVQCVQVTPIRLLRLFAVSVRQADLTQTERPCFEIDLEPGARGGVLSDELYDGRWIIQPVLILLACFLFYSFLKPPGGDGRARPRHRSPTMLAAGPRAIIRLEELADAKPNGYNWDGPGTIPIIKQLQIILRKPRHPRTMEVSVDCNDVYTFEFHDASGPIKSITLGPLDIEAGLNIYRGALPPEVTRAGVVKVVVKPKWGDDKYSIGHLLLKE